MRADRPASTTTRSLLSALLLLPALVAARAPGAERRSARAVGPPAQTASRDWLRVRPRGEQFGFQSPVAPGVFESKIEGEDSLMEIGGAKIERELTYHAYHDGAVYLVHVYESSSPQHVMDWLTGRSPLLKGVVAHDVRANGVEAREYEVTTEGFYRKMRFVVAGKFLYVLEAAARDARNPTLDRFLSSFTTGKPNPAGGDEVAPPDAGADSATQTDAGEVLKSKDTTLKAALVYRPEPNYTKQARREQITGTVRVRVVVSATGEVTNVVAVSRLPDGLTEKAIEAARAIKFIPAEKDGRRVSQYATIDYNFNLY